MAKRSESKRGKKKATTAKRSAPKRGKKRATVAKRSAPKGGKKKATLAKRSAPKGGKKKATILKRSAPKGGKKKATTLKRSAPKGGQKKATMATHTVDVCNDWNGSPGDQVDFTNPSATTTCNLTQDGTWPFVDGPPLAVPPAGKTTHLKPANELPNATYYYDVDCCANLTRKSVTVP